MEELEKDITFHRDALAVHPPAHPDRSMLLHNLAKALMSRYDLCSATEDMQNAISFYEEALTLRPPGHPDRTKSLNNLANTFMSRYSRFGEVNDLEKCISVHQNLLSLRPTGHPDRSVSLNNLANALRSRYGVLGQRENLDQCIEFQREALTLHPPRHPDRSMSLNNLAAAFLSRYDQFGRTEDLECINLYRDALDLCPHGHPNRPTSLNNYAVALKSRYRQTGKIEDLDDCISSHQEVLALRPPGHPHRSSSLNNLALALQARYDKFGKRQDLDNCILFHGEALVLRPPGHSDRSMSLNNLAIALMIRYNHFGKSEDLKNCISYNQDALSLCPPGHPDRAMSLSNLANALMSRYNEFGKTEDLEDCISFHGKALLLRPFGHPEHPDSLNNLAGALQARYNRFGKRNDLEDCISISRHALKLHLSGHSVRSTSLNNLSALLMKRYNQSGKIKDLEDCISLHREALILRPSGHPERSMSLNNLAIALMNRYMQSGEMVNLDECISLNEDALSLHASGHPDRSMALNNLAVALMSRYRQSEKIDDLERSISRFREALILRPSGHPYRPASLNNLGIVLNLSDKVENLQECITLQREALLLRPSGHPDRSSSLQTLATALMRYHSKLGRINDLRESFISYEQAANDVTSYLKDRLASAIVWAYYARDFGHTSTLVAYTTAVHLLNRSLVSRPSVESQHGLLSTASTPTLRSLASDAASAAIQEGNLELAVELLEQGRAMVWSKVDAYKYPLEELRQVQGGEELADRLEMLSAELEHIVLSSETAGNLSDKELATKEVLLDAQIKQHRILSEEWESLVGKIREIEGFASFLQAPPFSTLQSAAVNGPVILVNISCYRSDAIILPNTPNNPPILVALPELQLNELNDQAKKRSSNREIKGVLRYLWDNIASPIVDRLSELGIKKKGRIWWCPTGVLCALPLHAAGRGGQKDLPSLYTSSYISTLSSLIRARSSTAPPSISPKVLIVGHPSERQKLETVEVELDIVKKLVSDKSVDVLFGPAANCEAVLDGLKRHSWVHFACHGHLGPGNSAQPFQASFELHDGRHLPLLDLIQARIPNAELAFLSACHSAAGGSHTPDETIHLSAALQFCGFRSVVGTLWEMDDEDGPTISEGFYKYMFKNPEKIDFRDSAHALSSAIRAMRKDKLPPERWVMFVHIGA